eukprot:UN21956
MNKYPSIRNHFGLFLVCFDNFSRNIFKTFSPAKIEQKREIFFRKIKIIFFRTEICSLDFFCRESSDNLRHSVLSPKRFGQLEMKLEQKARPPPRDPGFRGGVRGYLNGLKGS